MQCCSRPISDIVAPICNVSHWSYSSCDKVACSSILPKKNNIVILFDGGGINLKKKNEFKEKQSLVLVPFVYLPTFAGKQGDRICPLQSWAD